MKQWLLLLTLSSVLTAAEGLRWQEDDVNLLVPADVASMRIELQLHNTGAEALSAVRIVASHPDIQVPAKDLEIPAGEQVTITCALDAAALQQTVRRQIRAIHPDSEQIVSCRLLLRVASPVRIEPSRLVWEAGATETQTLRISAADGADTSAWQLQPEHLAGFTTVQVRDADGLLLSITPQADASAGLSRLLLRTDRPEARFRDLPIEFLLLPADADPEAEAR